MCENYTLDCKQEEMGCKGCAYYKDEGMTIKTKYSIGQKVWVAVENNKNREIEVFSDTIKQIVVDSNGNICYMLEDLWEELKEDDILLYDDYEKLIERIKEIDKKITNRGEK